MKLTLRRHAFYMLLAYSPFASVKAQITIQDSIKDHIKEMSYSYSRVSHSRVYLCADADCDSNLCSENRVCARCCFLKADSLMNQRLGTILTSYRKAKKNTAKLVADQNKWILKRNVIASGESEQYKDTPFEMISFSLALTEETNKRTTYFMSVLSDSN